MEGLKVLTVLELEFRLKIPFLFHDLASLLIVVIVGGGKNPEHIPMLSIGRRVG